MVDPEAGWGRFRGGRSTIHPIAARPHVRQNELALGSLLVIVSIAATEAE
jgi:hypothetical protein